MNCKMMPMMYKVFIILLLMSSSNEHPNVHIFDNKVVKYVNEKEASRYNIVYPPNIVNTLLLERPVYDNTIGKYKVTMKLLYPFPSGKTLKTNISSGAFKMVSDQLNRLHKTGMTHSNLNAEESKKLKAGGKIDKFAPLKRQLLVEYNDNGTKITKIYLTNFNKRNTSNTIANEKTYLNQFRIYYNTYNNSSPSTRTAVNNNGYSTPVNNNGYSTPVNNNAPSSSRRRLF